MHKAYHKNIRRTIRQTLSRFGAIFAIVALGVGFLAGLLAATPDMRYSGDLYFDESRLFDLRIVGTMGVTDADAEALRAVPGVAQVMPGYEADMLLRDTTDNVYVTRLHSLPTAAIARDPDTESYLNRLEVLEGRLPQNAGECVIEQSSAYVGTPLGVGDTLSVDVGNKNPQDTLSRDMFTIVGVVQSSYYFSVERESASVGNGTIALIAYMGEDNFSAKAYTNLFVSLTDARALTSASDDYVALSDTVKARVEDISGARSEARLGAVKDEAQAKIDDAQKELDDGWQEYDDGKATADKELADARAKLAKGRRELLDAQADLKDANLKIIGGQADLDAATSNLPLMLTQKKAELDAAQAQLDTQKLQLEPLRLGLLQADAAVAQLQAAIAAITDPLDPSLPALQTQLAQAQGQAAALRAQYDPAAAAIAAAQTQLDAGRVALAQAGPAAQAQIDQGSAALADARKQYADGLQELEKGRQELADGEQEYETEKAKAEKKLADAKLELDDGTQELADAKKKLAELETPEWYVLGRDTNVSYASFDSNAQKVEAIATVFPIFFFLVAALVALTTMTRMVEEERLQIGTLKALGYSKGAIMSKYLLYAMLASVLGSTVGLLVGFWLFPTVIWNAYTMLYTLPKLYCQFNVKYAILASSAAIACTLLATLNACWATLMENPAALLLPRAPKAGKRILLERIGFVWKRMKFTHKVTMRNLFRYKKRFLMTVIGIAGCTALLVTGFGLHDSISDIVNKQFDDVFTYDVAVALRDKKALRSEALAQALQADSVSATLRVHQEQSDNTYDNVKFGTYLFVPENPAQLDDFIHLRQRLSGKAVAFPLEGTDSVVITEKMGERTGKGVGDEIVLKNSDNKKATFRITGVVENYVENYVYLSAETYTAQFGSAPDYTLMLVRMSDKTQGTRDALASELLKLDDVTGVNFISDVRSSFTNMMQKIDTIVVVLIISAGLLAFVVLYNLTNININERSKEIATIKVLGFYEREVQAYIYRESFLLSLIGTACGLVLGIFLHRFVIFNIEVDMVMFGRTIAPLSYLYAAVLTLLFSLLVNLVMKRKLRNISMVESMKAPE